MHKRTTALSSRAFHFLLLFTRLLPLSASSIVLHAPLDSSCRASTFHIITTSDVCVPEARRLAELPGRTNEEPALGSEETDSRLSGNSLCRAIHRRSGFVETHTDCNPTFPSHGRSCVLTFANATNRSVIGRLYYFIQYYYQTFCAQIFPLSSHIHPSSFTHSL